MGGNGPRHPADNRPTQRAAVVRSRVTRRPPVHTVGRVGSEWPVEDFNAFLEASMRAAGVKDRQELAELAGMNPTQLSNWKHGKSQPTRKSLEKIAPVLGVPLGNLLFLAGVAAEDDFAAPPDLTVIPAEFRDLLDLYADDRVTEDERQMLLSHVRVIAAGVRAGMESRESAVPRKRQVPRSTRPAVRAPRKSA